MAEERSGQVFYTVASAAASVTGLQGGAFPASAEGRDTAPAVPDNNHDEDVSALLGRPAPLGADHGGHRRRGLLQDTSILAMTDARFTPSQVWMIARVWTADSVVFISPPSTTKYPLQYSIPPRPFPFLMNLIHTFKLCVKL